MVEIVKKEMARERRIENEIIVDAQPEEIAMGWYYSLEDKISFPFFAKCITADKRSPLEIGEKVEVQGMSGEEYCESDMYVDIAWKGKSLAIPLYNLEPVDADANTVEIVGDWHYWKKRGYQIPSF
jgi:hypothetical protein